MVKMTQSLQHWLWENGYRKELVYIGFGHFEYFTDEMEKKYLEWVKTEEGKQYLKGGSKYKDEDGKD